MTTPLSENFTLEELTATSTGLPNDPTPEVIAQLRILAATLLQPIRTYFGWVRVHCGFRAPAVNAADGGSPTSQHPLGQAADFDCPLVDLWSVFLWCMGHLVFGQLIYELKSGPNGTVERWLHISLPRDRKPNQVAEIGRNGVYTPYVVGIDPPRLTS